MEELLLELCQAGSLCSYGGRQGVPPGDNTEKEVSPRGDLSEILRVRVERSGSGGSWLSRGRDEG